MALPEVVLPKWMDRINVKLPGKPPHFILVSVLNAMLKKGLLPTGMESFVGRRFEIEVLDAGITVRFSADNQKLTDDNFNGTSDLWLAANDIDFMRMVMCEENPDTLFLNRKLQIEDDTELGLMTRNLLDSVNWPFGGWLLNKGISSQRLGTYRLRPFETFSDGPTTVKGATFMAAAISRPYTTWHQQQEPS